jgi:hypothetical protein
MKEGCKIVSLKSFVPAGHKIQSRNLNSPINLLKVEHHISPLQDIGDTLLLKKVASDKMSFAWGNPPQDMSLSILARE